MKHCFGNSRRAKELRRNRIHRREPAVRREPRDRTAPVPAGTRGIQGSMPKADRDSGVKEAEGSRHRGTRRIISRRGVRRSSRLSGEKKARSNSHNVGKKAGDSRLSAEKRARDIGAAQARSSGNREGKGARSPREGTIRNPSNRMGKDGTITEKETAGMGAEDGRTAGDIRMSRKDRQ